MPLAFNSVLFWLIALIGVGIIFIGARFFVMPSTAARDFGVPASGEANTAYFWTKGTRDISLGLLLIGFLWMHAGSGVLAAYLLIAALIPIGDFVNVYAHAEKRNVPALLIHGGTAVYMCVLAAILLRG